MGVRTFHQYFGPSARHPRACVELRFAPGTRPGGGLVSIAPMMPMLQEMGFKLSEPLPSEPLPEEEAVARLAGALLSRHRSWWTGHGRADGTAWAALDFPMPRVATSALDCAYVMIARGDDLTPKARTHLADLARWVAGSSKIRQWMPAIAGIFDREAAVVGDRNDVYQVGQGAKGVQFYRLASQFDSIVAPLIEGNKFTTVEFMQRFGLPTTRAVLVGEGDALGEAIAKVGLPCVVKPLKLGRGVGVATALDSEAAVATAVRYALSLGGPQVQIENHVEGDDHRIIVINGEVLSVYRKVRPTVVGNGVDTVGELIAGENRRRDATYSRNNAYLDLIKVDEESRQFLAARHAITLDGVLEEGREIEVVSQGNASRGAFLDDATGRTHPDNRALFVRLARLFRLGATGIDFITTDISRSWKDIPCAIIEINRTPGLSGYGDAVAIQREFFRQRQSGMIPTVAVIGDEAYRAHVAAILTDGLSARGLRTATADYTAGTLPADGTIQFSPVAPPIENLWLDPEADAALVMCGPDQVEASGLPLRRCDVLVVQDAPRFAWLDGRAETVIAGTASPATLDRIAKNLARRYADPAQGGPAPALDPLDDAADGQFRVRVWRTRAAPRGWFWDHVGIAPANRDGLTTHDDLLAAAHALAAQALGADLAPFTCSAIRPSWARVSFTAAIALPKKQPEAARAALLAAVERVNAITALKAG
jgi:D-alanine-D-alanine ligase-like ATP-grasp enzyme